MMKIPEFLLPAVLISCLFSCNHKESQKRISQTDPLMIENIFPFQQLHCHGSSIAELPNGDMMTVWFYGSGERTADDVKIMGSRRNHKTGKWCEPFVMADVPGFPDINPVLFVDPQKRLWLVWYTVIAYQWETSILKYRISENYQQESGPPEWKWQDIIHVKSDGSTPDGIGTNDAFVATLKRKYSEYYESLIASGEISRTGLGAITDEMWNAGIERYMNIAMGKNLESTGTDINEKGEKIKTRLGYPLMRRIGWQTRNKPLFTGSSMLLPLYSDGFDFSLIAITDDYGKNWTFSEPVVGAGSIQPALVQCADSSIVSFMRDNGPSPQRLMKSISRDSGKTWRVVENTEIPNPGSAADVIKLKSGSWVYAGNDLEEGRYRLSVWLSADEGKTWPYRKSIVNGEPGSQTRAHYPSLTEGSDNMIWISYTNQVPDSTGRGSLKNIAVAVFSESWIKKNDSAGQ